MISSRNFQFIAFSLLLMAIFFDPVRRLASLSYSSSLFSYILFVPFVSLYFMYMKKGQILSCGKYSLPAGILTILAGLVLYFICEAWGPQLSSNDYTSLIIFSALVIWMGGFAFFYGTTALRLSLFPLGFLFFIVPIPNLLLEPIIIWLQRGSAEVSNWIFQITGALTRRDGFIFYLSKIEIEVAKECSGIRSSLLLLMTGLVFAKLFLKTPLRRTLLVLSVVPITVFKNALRIVTLSLIANYISEDILSSAAHRQGGVPFFILAVVLLALVVRELREPEEQLLFEKN